MFSEDHCGCRAESGKEGTARKGPARMGMIFLTRIVVIGKENSKFQKKFKFY